MPTTPFNKTALPAEVSTTSFTDLPYADIENDYNKLVRSLKELWAALNGEDAGTDANGNALQNYLTIGALDQIEAITKGKMAATSALTIASDIITVTGFYHIIDTEASAASDNLVTINGGANTRMLFLRTNVSTRDVVIKNSGNITTPGGLDVTLDTVNNIAFLVYNNTTSKWDLMFATQTPASLISSGAPAVAGQYGYNSGTKVAQYYDTAVRTLLTPRRYVAGPAPTWTSVSSITISAGVIATDSTFAQTIVVGSNLVISLAASGALGLDTGAEAANTWYYVYLVMKSSDGTVSAVVSVTNESVSGSITQPAGGYDLKVQLPFAIRNNASSDLIRFKIVSFGNGRTKVRWAATASVNGGGSITTGALNVLAAGASGTFATVTCTSLIPPLSQVGYFQCLAQTNGWYGEARTDSTVANPMEVSGAVQGGHHTELQLTSGQVFEYRRVGGTGTVYFDVLGYDVTELM